MHAGVWEVLDADGAFASGGTKSAPAQSDSNTEDTLEDDAADNVAGRQSEIGMLLVVDEVMWNIGAFSVCRSNPSAR